MLTLIIQLRFGSGNFRLRCTNPAQFSTKPVYHFRLRGRHYQLWSTPASSLSSTISKKIPSQRCHLIHSTGRTYCCNIGEIKRVPPEFARKTLVSQHFRENRTAKKCFDDSCIAFINTYISDCPRSHANLSQKTKRGRSKAPLSFCGSLVASPCQLFVVST